MDVVLVVVRIGLAITLVVAAVAKVTDREGFRATLSDFRVPRRLIVPVGAAVPAVELVLAAGLLVQATAAWAAAASAALLAAFAVAQAAVLRRGDEAECRCFGRFSDGPVDRRSLVRTVALAAIAAAVAVVGWNDPGASPVGWLGGLSTTEALLAAAIVVLAIVAAGQGAFSWQLLRQQGRLLGRIDELEGALGLIGKVRGDEVDASLLDADDRVVPLADVVAGEGETVVVFTDSGCGACEPLLPLLGQAQRVGRPRIVVVGSGDRDANLAKAAEHGIEGMLFQSAFDASSTVGVRGFPGAVTLGPEGSLLAAPALGAEAVRTVLDARVPELTVVEVAGR